ncbi:MAG: DUF1987 domain-containing protein [Bacteroidales bacterium]|nr:DUF1987 domain-containing protein [Bacteroidales bacterium]
MNPLRINETSDTPEVNLDQTRGRFEFYGKSMPEDPNEFFTPIINWLKEYITKPNKETVLIFKMDYFNTASSKKILEILSVLLEIHKKKQTVIVNWHYRSNDDDMKETGETFSEIIHIPFRITPY